MFIGRDFELDKLSQLYQSSNSRIIVVYGRRRIGKSSLIEQFVKNQPALTFEGIENQNTKEQIKQFTNDLRKQIKDKILESVNFEGWEQVFDYLTEYFKGKKKKQVLFLDEFQWLAANQTKLVSLIKKHWETDWKKQNVMLILCGSVSSYMVKRVILSNALYGRIDFELCLEQLSPLESFKLLNSKRSKEEIFKYMLLFGGVPKYLEIISSNKSFEQNINDLFFIKGAFFASEYEKIFYSQFREHKNYERIVKYLEKGSRSLNEIAKHLKLVSSGGVKVYLRNLEDALFITSYTPFDKGLDSKLKKYKLTDAFIRFFFKFMLPNLKIIKTNKKRNLFNVLVKNNWAPWLGFAFENFCIQNAEFLAEKMGFADKLKNWGPYFRKGDKGFQIDLIFYRSDMTITLCEMKYYNKPVTTKIILEMECKCKLLKIPRGFTLERAIVSQYGADQALIDTGYFHHNININDLFES